MAARPFSDRWYVVATVMLTAREGEASGYDDAQTKAAAVKRAHPGAVVYVEHVRSYHSGDVKEPALEPPRKGPGGT